MTLRFQRAFDPRYGKAVAVPNGVRRVTAPNPNPFTFQGTNTYLIGSGELIVLDPGPADPRHLQALCGAIGSAEVAAIVATHSHLDHVEGARQLQDAVGAPILAALRSKRPALLNSQVQVDAVAENAFAPDRVLQHGDMIEAGGIRLRAIATLGHASDHMAFAMVGTDVMFSGDHVMGWSTTVVAPPDGSMRYYMESLELLLEEPGQFYLPGHGGEISGAHAYVRGLRAHRRMRERAIMDRLRQGDQTIPEVVAAIYPEIEPRLSGAASLSTLAHLEDLIDRRLVETAGPIRLDGCYGVAGRGEGVAGAGPGG